MTPSPATPEPGTPDRGSLVDADEFLSFTARLRAVRDRVEAAPVSEEQRGRWQSRLAAISGGGGTDLERAQAQLGRLEAEVDRRQ